MKKEVKENFKEIFTFDKYPDWVKDDRDKIIHYLLIRHNCTLTFNQLENEVNKILVSKIVENKLIERLRFLQDKGYIENVPKDTEILVWKAKEIDKLKEKVELKP